MRVRLHRLNLGVGGRLGWSGEARYLQVACKASRKILMCMLARASWYEVLLMWLQGNVTVQSHLRVARSNERQYLSPHIADRGMRLHETFARHISDRITAHPRSSIDFSRVSTLIFNGVLHFVCRSSNHKLTSPSPLSIQSLLRILHAYSSIWGLHMQRRNPPVCTRQCPRLTNHTGMRSVSPFIV